MSETRGPVQQSDEAFARLRADVQAGLEQIRRGRFSEHDAGSGATMAKAIKLRGRQRLKEQRRPPRQDP